MMARLLGAVAALLLAGTAMAEELKLAVTTSFDNSGLSDVLLPVIKEDLGIDVQLLVVGTGQALRLGRATLRTIRQNLFWAFAYNVVGIPVAAGLLYPVTGWLLSPVLASAAMSLSSVSVLASSLRLRRFR